MHSLFWRLFKFILAWSIFKFTTREGNWADFRNLVHLSAICQEPNQLVEILLKVSEPHHLFLPYSAVSFWNFDKLLCYLHGLVPHMVRLSLPKLGEGSITRPWGMLLKVDPIAQFNFHFQLLNCSIQFTYQFWFFKHWVNESWTCLICKRGLRVL